jgi:heme oxygenase
MPAPMGAPVDVADDASAFGAAYVVEGSMLGGQHVARAVARDLGLGTERLRYLRPADVAVGPRWTAFVEALDAFGAVASPAEWTAAEAAARSTFEAFTEAFRREGLL